ncbi:hypothetical protein COCSADRAFT_76883 [Bipolaris sorokiniana ND90Pr]|uniref:Zn(2)-C6 fungal-type domain-containing protein n=1 Tax=Cochliobolus sativus (strain ND90Pr / ATCC 201652) TaxID=665912 RepID=M2RTV6_COCSN|nr:uncharacterized protein COCSADRAFT_76883 [Bipolaris sorokiniana ND90Pr]EMD70034.1 hypothetical protein COCSADRAFT_76883 [Bipolaris sorokiniana ND90Pr]
MSSRSQDKRRIISPDVPVKRFRVSRACDQCRTAREKCDGNQPTCSPCVDNKRDCTYTSNPKKRGLQPGYIRGLETTLAFVFQRNPEIETTVYNQLFQENTILLARGTKESNRLYKSWTKSRFCQDLTKALAGEQIETREEKQPSPNDDSDVDIEDSTFNQTTPGAQSHQSFPSVSAPSHVPEQTPRPSLSDFLFPSVQQSVIPSALIPLPADSWKLLETYCTYTQCWLPIADKLEILKLSYSYPEHGLELSCDMPNSGSHAEMWSIFAVGSLQIDSRNTNADLRDAQPEKFYDVARLLIPNELGQLGLDHVKALLNLAVFNISKKLFSAAWRLVGTALRIFLTTTNPPNMNKTQRNHILSSCFVLDTLLSSQLKLRPYLEKADLDWMGKIEEDGMEEWQPWNGQLRALSVHQPPSPTLSLSTFNALLDLVDIFGSTTRPQNAPNFLHEMISRLEVWKSSLPQKLDYIRKDSTPMTPPALLLRFTYCVTALAFVPSHNWFRQTLDVLSTMNAQLGAVRIPAIVFCLLKSIKKSSSTLVFDQTTHTKMRELFTSLDQSLGRPEEASTGTREATDSHENIPQDVSGLVQASPSFPIPNMGEPFIEGYQRPSGSSTHVDSLLPAMNIAQEAGNQHLFNPFDFTMNILMPESHDPYNALISGDLGNFLDDFASEHGAKKLQNQPQFMENLGFSAEISMADLLATDPTRFLTAGPQPAQDDNQNSTQLPFNTLYETG